MFNMSIIENNRIDSIVSRYLEHPIAPLLTLNCDFASSGYADNAPIASLIIQYLEKQKLQFGVNFIDYGGFVFSPNAYLFLYQHGYIATMDYSYYIGTVSSKILNSPCYYNFIVIPEPRWRELSNRNLILTLIDDTIQSCLELANLYV